MNTIKTIEQIRKSFKEYHFTDWYREETHVRMDNEAFPHTFNASGLENQIKAIIDKWIMPIKDKLFCIQPCFRRFDIENIERNWYSIFFQMCGKVHFTPNLKEELPNYFQKHLDFFTKKLWLDKSKLRFTIFGWGKIATIGNTEMPEDTRSKEMLNKMWIQSEKVISIKSPEWKWEIDNFLVRFEREREKYAGYGIDIYYDLGTEKQLDKNDFQPGNIKWWRFMEISTTRICDLWRTSEYGQKVEIINSPLPCVVSWASLERLAFVLQNTWSVFEIDIYQNIFEIIKRYWFSDTQIKKFIALLVPLYYIISEWNIPWWSNTWKNRDLRMLCKDIFEFFNSSDSFEWLSDHIQSDSQLNSKRKIFFRELSLKEKSFFSRTYAEILKIYNSVYNTLEGKHKNIIDIMSNEKAVYLEDKYQKILENK